MLLFTQEIKSYCNKMLQNVKTKVVSATRDLEKQWDSIFKKVVSGEARIDPETGIVDYNVDSASRNPLSGVHAWMAMIEIGEGSHSHIP